MHKIKLKTFLTIAIFLISIFFHNCDLTETVYVSKWTKGKQITSGDDSLIPDSVKSLLREDAAILALRDVHSDPNDKQNLIILPQELVELYYDGFVHVYNADSLAARDSVIELYNIHSFRRPEPHSIIVAVDSIKNWVNNWRIGQRLTGNLYIDSLMENYNLQLMSYHSSPWSHAAVLQSPKPINISALAKKFATIDGVIYAEENHTIGDGDDIDAVIEPNYLAFVFSEGWGDCPAGCIDRHYWLFNVRYDGTVEFIRSYGDPLP